MKKVKAINGYTIYKATEKDLANYECTDYYVIYFSHDIKEYGRAYSDIEYEAGSLNEAIAFCSSDDDYAIIREELYKEYTAVTFEDIEAEQKRRAKVKKQAEKKTAKQKQEEENAEVIKVMESERLSANMLFLVVPKQLRSCNAKVYETSKGYVL